MPSDETLLLALAALGILAAILGIAALSIVSSWPYRRLKSAPLAACPLCSYSFAGLAANSACPECGAPLHKQLAAARARDPDRVRNVFRRPINVILMLSVLLTGLVAYRTVFFPLSAVLFATAFFAWPLLLLSCTIPSVARRTSRLNLTIWTLLGCASIFPAQLAVRASVVLSRDPQAGITILFTPILGTMTLAIGLFFAAAVLHRSTTRKSTKPPDPRQSGECRQNSPP
jgi:hypothetical protein